MFVYHDWENFCCSLDKKEIHSITATAALGLGSHAPFFILKHDVETNPSKALKMAEIEHTYGHCGSYYVQAYLLKTPKNISILRQIQSLGHEVSYHHDVMDSNGGDINKAIIEFDKNCSLFIEKGFTITTVCQHGNPVAQRKNYTSNRDFFRSPEIQARYPGIVDIMVNFPEKLKGTYTYISDAGMGFKIIHDPIHNDIVDTEDKNIFLGDLSAVKRYIDDGDKSILLSTHPHRWQRNIVIAATKKYMFLFIKAFAKLLMKIPFLKRLMEKYYYLAKKI
jgi:hypothetical protein